MSSVITEHIQKKHGFDMVKRAEKKKDAYIIICAEGSIIYVVAIPVSAGVVLGVASLRG
jgi:hypothetical protein